MAPPELMARQELLQRFDDFEQDTLEQLSRMNRSILEAFKFNFILSQLTAEEERKEIAQKVKEYKEKEWKKAMQKAGGQVAEAYQEYAKEAFFV